MSSALHVECSLSSPNEMVNHLWVSSSTAINHAGCVTPTTLSATPKGGKIVTRRREMKGVQLSRKQGWRKGGGCRARHHPRGNIISTSAGLSPHRFPGRLVLGDVGHCTLLPSTVESVNANFGFLSKYGNMSARSCPLVIFAALKTASTVEQ